MITRHPHIIDKTTVCIPWEWANTGLAGTVYFNEICARAIDRFGLPGDRFETHAHQDYMYFHFKNEQDALMFMLMS